LEKNVAQHRIDERIMSYKLEIYQNNFLDFVCGSPTSIEASDKDEEVEVGPIRIAQEEEVQLKNHRTSEEKQLSRRKYRQRNTRLQGRGPKRKKTTNNLRTKVGGVYSSHRRRGIQDITPRNKNID